MTLRVGLNALFLHFPRSGTGRYLRNLIDGASDRVDLSLVGAKAFPRDDPASDFLAREVTTPFDRNSKQLAKVWFEQAGFGFAARRLGVDVAHAPYFGSGVVSLLPTIVTVHDLIPIVRPEYRRSASESLYSSLVTLGLRSASAILTDSAASARDLRSYLKVSDEKIHVVPLGVDQRFRPLRSPEELAWAAVVRSNLAVFEPYLLYVGGFDRRKNVARLIEAFSRLRHERQIRHSLILVGALRSGQALFYDPHRDIERHGVADSVRLLGARSDDEVRALLAGADAFVFPSEYEGFGLPPLEAMASGTPVICSNASSLPEVVGDAGELFDPTSVDDIVAVIAEVLDNPDKRFDLAKRGIERARAFTWDATVDATLKVYESVAGKSR
jgi:glycosyltransferase involved in cell wall biosynthesis